MTKTKSFLQHPAIQQILEQFDREGFKVDSWVHYHVSKKPSLGLVGLNFYRTDEIHEFEVEFYRDGKIKIQHLINSHAAEKLFPGASKENFGPP